MRKAAPPAPKGLRISGYLQEEPSLAARPAVQKTTTGGKTASATPVEDSVVPVRETLATLKPEAPTPPAKEASHSPDIKAESADASSGKRRNVVVRTFQRVFHPHPKTGDSEAPGEAKGNRLATRPDQDKQPR